MKLAIYLSAILVLGILVISPTSGYESLYGRTFNLFNLLKSPQNQFKSLLSRYSVLDASFNFLSSQYASLQSQITSLTSQISALTTIVNSIVNTTPKCLTTPSTVAATFIAAYQKCYSLEVGPLAYDAAQLKCMQQGGTLAEPLYTDTTFYPNLLNTFPTATFTSIAGTGLYVGVSMHKTDGTNINYAYNSNGALIPRTDTIWQPPGLPAALMAPATGVKKVAFIPTPSGTPATWKLTGEDPGTTARGFVCQYPVW